MRIIIFYLFCCLLFFNCNKNKEGKIKIVERKTDSIKHNKNPTVKEKVKNLSCFDKSFTDLLTFFEVSKNEYKDITRRGMLSCFLDKNKMIFRNIEKEVFYELIDSLNYKETIEVKQLVFANSLSAKSIFKEYKKGYHDRCLGIKEPNFIVTNEKNVYIFFIHSEYYRNLIVKLKKDFLSLLQKNKCSVDIIECR